MDLLMLNAQSTALVLIDLQQAVVGRTLAPWSGAKVVKACCVLADAFRRKGAMVVYVRVDLTNVQRPEADEPMRPADALPPPAAASELVPEAGFQEGDVLITKRHWGAFGGTEVEGKLRERGIQ